MRRLILVRKPSEDCSHFEIWFQVVSDSYIGWQHVCIRSESAAWLLYSSLCVSTRCELWADDKLLADSTDV